jgi:hypothetical protein
MFLNLNGTFIFVAGKTQSETESLLFATEEFGFDKLRRQLIIKNVIFMNKFHHLFVLFCLILLLNQLFSSLLKVEIIIFNQRFLIKIRIQRICNN